MERSYGGSELGFKSLTFSPFIITRHSLGMGFTTDGEGREERVWLAINLSKLEMSRPTQPRQGAGGALISPLSRPPTPLSLYSLPLSAPPPLQMFAPAPPPGYFLLGLSTPGSSKVAWIIARLRVVKSMLNVKGSVRNIKLWPKLQRYVCIGRNAI